MLVFGYICYILALTFSHFSRERNRQCDYCKIAVTYSLSGFVYEACPVEMWTVWLNFEV